jgi:hypothetical protein
MLHLERGMVFFDNSSGGRVKGWGVELQYCEPKLISQRKAGFTVLVHFKAGSGFALIWLPGSGSVLGMPDPQQGKLTKIK